MREMILGLLSEKEDLPPLPEIVIRLRMLLANPGVNVSDIAAVIEMEPVLAGRVLGMANSAFYLRNSKPITSLAIAITKLGFKMLTRIVFSFKLVSLFVDGGGMNARAFWRHSLAVAVFTQAISRRVKASWEEQEIAYLAGLMHDVGIMVFAHLIPAEYAAFLRNAHEVELPIEAQELKTFGIDHPELGALFIERWWNIEEHIIKEVRNHHMPFQCVDKERHCTQLVGISNALCNHKGITNGVHCKRPPFDDIVWNELGFSSIEAEDLIADLKTALDEAELFLARK